MVASLDVCITTLLWEKLLKSDMIPDEVLIDSFHESQQIERGCAFTSIDHLFLPAISSSERISLLSMPLNSPFHAVDVHYTQSQIYPHKLMVLKMRAVLVMFLCSDFFLQCDWRKHASCVQRSFLLTFSIFLESPCVGGVTFALGARRAS
jgi:hypothetical protein